MQRLRGGFMKESNAVGECGWPEDIPPIDLGAILNYKMEKAL